jgi:hypothetical protein
MVYCGKNSKSSVARYACFKKGVGVGLRMTPKKTIKSRKKMYCGKKSKTPNNYDFSGTHYQCLQRGISVGRRPKSKKSRKIKRRKRK